jgi:hypothetical protein
MNELVHDGTVCMYLRMEALPGCFSHHDGGASRSRRMRIFSAGHRSREKTMGVMLAVFGGNLSTAHLSTLIQMVSSV